MAKRLFDVLLAGMGLLLSWPLLLLLAVWVRLDSPGPALYRQLRVGRGGVPFRIRKFRTMFVDAGGPPLTVGDDPRITRAGRMLRRTRLDELPQLYNILRGDMSFVGPRAWADYELENYKDWHFRRLEVLPGLTGLAQISGRSALAFDEIIRLDIEYIDNRSMQQDIKIMLRTVPVVAAGNNSG